MESGPRFQIYIFKGLVPLIRLYTFCLVALRKIISISGVRGTPLTLQILTLQTGVNRIMGGVGGLPPAPQMRVRSQRSTSDSAFEMGGVRGVPLIPLLTGHDCKPIVRRTQWLAAASALLWLTFCSFALTFLPFRLTFLAFELDFLAFGLTFLAFGLDFLTFGYM